MTRRLTPGRVDSQFQRAAHVNRHTPTRATLEHELELAHALANRARLSPVPFGASDTLPRRSVELAGPRALFLGRLLGLRVGLAVTLRFDRRGRHRVLDGDLGADLELAGDLRVLGARDLPLLLALL